MKNGYLKPLSQRVQTFFDRVTPLLVRWRKWALAFCILLLVVFETAEHLIRGAYGEQAAIGFDLFLYLLLLPAGSWFILGVLENNESRYKLLNQDHDWNVRFSQSLGNARGWPELIQRIMEYAHQVAPSAVVTLFVNDPHAMRMQPEAICGRDGKIAFHPSVSISPDTLPLGSLPQLLRQTGSTRPAFRPAVAGSANEPDPPSLPPHRYDVPVAHNDQPIGVLKLEFPTGSTPSKWQVLALKNASAVMALALEGAQLQSLAAEQAAASESQRQEIAQNLHDTLAQNIGYLRLKLDQLSGENAIREIGVVLQELEHMRATADEAYQQVRDTLDELTPLPATDLCQAITAQAEATCQRSGIKLHARQAGAPFSLPSGARQQIEYIAREALHNIEKHAYAQNVTLQLLWLEAELIVKITDDGVGFNPLSVPVDGHYGLWIMQHRAQEMGGTLKITPADGKGTEVTLWVPRPAYSSGPA